MSSPYSLFEISWEVCNKVGGIYTVLTTRAKTMVERFGDDYVAIGPWLLSEEGTTELPFEPEPGFEPFIEACRKIGLPVKVGRWTIPGRPRTILVEFSSLYEKKDDVLADLWREFQVDSISGDWDYVEPVLFGHAAALVIELWWDEYLAPHRRRSITHAHEWMTGSALLRLKHTTPSMGTIFTTHATMLGRALSSLGVSPEDGLGDRTPEELAEENNVVAKHSLEGVCAREADVFTTVSEITAREAELLHRRTPDPILPNGIDLEVIDALAGSIDRSAARERLTTLASKFLGEDASDAALLAVSGRYEFHNKGIDLLLDALAWMNGREGRDVVLFVLVPAGNSGPRKRDARASGLGRARGRTGRDLDAPPVRRGARPGARALRAPGPRQRRRESGQGRADPDLLLGERRVPGAPVRGRAARNGPLVLPLVLRAVGLHAAGEPRRRRPDDHLGLRRLRALGRRPGARPRGRRGRPAPLPRRVPGRDRGPGRRARAPPGRAARGRRDGGRVSPHGGAHVRGPT